MAAGRSSPAPVLDHEPMSVKAAKNLFRKYDTDKDGTISREDLWQILTAVCPELTTVEFDKLVRAVDKNRDLKIQYDEFVELIFMDIGEAPRPARRYVSPDAVRVIFGFWNEVTREKQPGSTVKRADMLEALARGSAVIRNVRALPFLRDSDGSSEENRTLARLQSREVVLRFQEGPAVIDREACVRAIWPKVRPSDLEYAVEVMSRQLAELNIGGLCADVLAGRSPSLSASDVAWTFNTLDHDKDGQLTVKELVMVGGLEMDDALKLSERLDSIVTDGGINLKELMTAITKHANNEFSASFRGLFASTLAD